MATLKAQIETDLRVMIDSQTLIDQGNQRDSSATTENTAKTALAASYAAAAVQEVLGDDIDSTDVQALAIGVRIAKVYLDSHFNIVTTEPGSRALNDPFADLEKLAARRVAENSAPYVDTPDFQDHDDLYPFSTWDS